MRLRCSSGCETRFSCTVRWTIRPSSRQAAAGTCKSPKIPAAVCAFRDGAARGAGAGAGQQRRPNGLSAPIAGWAAVGERMHVTHTSRHSNAARTLRDARQAGPCSGRWSRAWATCTVTASSTATSRPPTCCSPRTCSWCAVHVVRIVRSLRQKIGDFGLACRAGPHDKAHTTLCGTANFIAPCARAATMSR